MCLLVQALHRSALSHQERIGPAAALHTKWQVKAEAGIAVSYTCKMC